MSMHKSKTPIVWALIIYIVYVLFELAALLILGPYSFTTKFLFGMLGLLLCILMTALYFLLVRRPLPSDHILMIVSPFAMGIIGLSQTCLGSLSLYSLLDALPAVMKVADTPWKLYMNVGGAVMLPVGLLVFIFSSLQLILNRKSK